MNWEKISVIMVFLLAVLWCCGAFADYTDDEYVQAIYQAEGSKATYAYGIRSVKYKDIAEARQICYNTVKNNRKRYAEYGYKDYDSYISFLASRYCPVGADNDPKGLNKNWIKNVTYFLEGGAK